MNQTSDLSQAIVGRDELLGRYNPLARVLMVSDFQKGMNGWQTYFPDYDGWEDYEGRYGPVAPLKETVAKAMNGPEMRIDRKPPLGPRGVPMISSLTSWDIGTSGGWGGTYALKIPTIAHAGHTGLCVKRLATPFTSGLFRIETWFAFKAEPSDLRLGELDVHSLLLAFEVMESHGVKKEGRKPLRWWPSVRYLNAENGQLEHKWQAIFSGSDGVVTGPWENVPKGQQDLGFNRSATKYQWQYLRFTFDLDKHEYVDLNCAGEEFDVAGRKHVMDPPLTGFRAGTDHCSGLLAAVFGIQTNSDKRCFLYLDSVVVSAASGSSGSDREQ